MSSSSAVQVARGWAHSAPRFSRKPALVVLLVLVELIVWSGLQPQLAKAVTPPADANLGQQGWYKLEKDRLTDKSQLSVNVGNGNKTNNNSGVVNGVLIQNLGGSKGAGKGAGAGPTVNINAVNNLGNANGQVVGGKNSGGGSSPNQNSSQNFNSHP